MRAEVSSGRSDFDSSSPTNEEMPGSAGAVAASIGALPPSPAAGKVEVRTVMTLICVLRLHRLHRVAGIDQALESVGRDHFDDVGNLHHVEQRGDARHEILAGRGGGARRSRHSPAPARRSAPRSAPPACARRAQRRRSAPWRRLAAWRRLRQPDGSLARRPARAPAPPSAAAAVSALLVASLSDLLSCSATRSVVIPAPPPLSACRQVPRPTRP